MIEGGAPKAVPQPPFLVRSDLLYPDRMVVQPDLGAGWAGYFCGTIIGLPLGVLMLNRAPGSDDADATLDLIPLSWKPEAFKTQPHLGRSPAGYVSP